MVEIVKIVVEPLTAAAAGVGVAYMMEENDEYNNMETLLKYGLIVAGCQFVGKRLVDMVIPEFKNANLRSMQRISLSAASTATLNIVAQRYLSKDLRIENSIASGAVGGALAPLVSSMF